MVSTVTMGAGAPIGPPPPGDQRGTVVVVTSGKGGVGKSTTSAAVGAALAMLGDTVVMVDFDIGLRKLDLLIGAERQVVYDVIDVLEGKATVGQALARAKQVDGLWILAASSIRDKTALTEDGVRRVIDELSSRFRWVICDSPAGIEVGAEMAMMEADVALVIVNPEVASIRDADRLIGLLDSKTKRARDERGVQKHVIVTRYDPARAARGQMMSIELVSEALSMPVFGVVGDSPDILDSSNFGRPVTFYRPEGESAKAYVRIAKKLRGEVEASPKGFFSRLFGRG